MKPFDNRDLIGMTKDLTVALLSGTSLEGKTNLEEKIPTIMQSIYDKLAELNALEVQ